MRQLWGGRVRQSCRLNIPSWASPGPLCIDHTRSTTCPPREREGERERDSESEREWEFECVYDCVREREIVQLWRSVWVRESMCARVRGGACKRVGVRVRETEFACVCECVYVWDSVWQPVWESNKKNSQKISVKINFDLSHLSCHGTKQQSSFVRVHRTYILFFH